MYAQFEGLAAMAHTVSIPLPTATGGAEVSARGSKSPLVRMMLRTMRMFSGAFGGVWDISWHESIGRDGSRTRTPADDLYLCGVLAKHRTADA